MTGISKCVLSFIHSVAFFFHRCTDFAVQDKSMDHPPIYNYKEDPYMQVDGKSHLPDVVIQGVLMGLYGNF